MLWQKGRIQQGDNSDLQGGMNFQAENRHLVFEVLKMFPNPAEQTFATQSVFGNIPVQNLQGHKGRTQFLIEFFHDGHAAVMPSRAAN